MLTTIRPLLEWQEVKGCRTLDPLIDESDQVNYRLTVENRQTSPVSRRCKVVGPSTLSLCEGGDEQILSTQLNC